MEKGGDFLIKRTVSFFCVLLCIMGGMLIKIMYISTGKVAKETSVTQSRRVMELAETRAGIFDRNLLPLVNKNLERRILIFPDMLEVSAILEFSDREELADAFQKFDPTVIDSGGKII